MILHDGSSAFDHAVCRAAVERLAHPPACHVFVTGAGATPDTADVLDLCRADGVLCSCHRSRSGRAEWTGRIPTVAFAESMAEASNTPHSHLVVADNQAIGRAGAEHLLERGFPRLSFCGYASGAKRSFSAERAAAFKQRAALPSVPCEILELDIDGTDDWAKLPRRLADWLQSLPQPFGIMAADDAMAQHLVLACQLVNAKVPEGVAILGAGNDTRICELCPPGLSSVESAGPKVGRMAAELLDRLMRGEHAGPTLTVAAPRGAVARESTDTIAVRDRLVSAALGIVRTKACDGIKIGDVAALLSVSRSTLQVRFKAAVGRTLHQEISKTRISSACRLLESTGIPIKQISAKSGFRTVQHLTSAFRAATGTTPAFFRRSMRQSTMECLECRGG